MIQKGPISGARRNADRLFTGLCYFAASFAVFLLIVLLVKIGTDGYQHVSLKFLESWPSSYDGHKAGIKSSIIGSAMVMVLTGIIAVPLGIAAAVYLEEFTRRKNRLTNFIQVNIANLAGVPSIVYGLLGLAVFVRWMQLGTTVVAGALTMSLLILPMIIIVTQESLRAVPNSYREAAYGLGATQWQVIRGQVLPSALPGILTGVILSLSRAIGETAPLIVVGAVGFVNFMPRDLHSPYTVLPLQIFNWANRPEVSFQEAAAGAIIVLMATLLVMNSIAIWLRLRAKRRTQ